MFRLERSNIGLSGEAPSRQCLVRSNLLLGSTPHPSRAANPDVSARVRLRGSWGFRDRNLVHLPVVRNDRRYGSMNLRTTDATLEGVHHVLETIVDVMPPDGKAIEVQRDRESQLVFGPVAYQALLLRLNRSALNRPAPPEAWRCIGGQPDMQRCLTLAHESLRRSGARRPALCLPN